MGTSLESAKNNNPTLLASDKALEEVNNNLRAELAERQTRLDGRELDIDELKSAANRRDEEIARLSDTTTTQAARITTLTAKLDESERRARATMSQTSQGR